MPIQKAIALNTRRLLAYKTRVLKTLSYYKSQYVSKTSKGEDYFYHPHYDEIIGPIKETITELEAYHLTLKAELENREHLEKKA